VRVTDHRDCQAPPSRRATTFRPRLNSGERRFVELDLLTAEHALEGIRPEIGMPVGCVRATPRSSR